jgi:hypothetical protein
MNAISQRLTTQHTVREELHSDARTELARHYLDLRIHALVMLSTAILAGYCGVRILNLDGAMVAGQPVWIANPPDFMSICAATIFLAIGSVCLRQAHRGWRKATIAASRT